MKSVFVDANVVIDYLSLREPFSTEAAELFELADNDRIKIFVSAVSFNVIYYILRQQLGHKASIGALSALSSMVTIISVTADILNSSLTSDLTDFEDAIQYYTALSEPGIEAIITRDKKGFRKSELPIFKPGEALRLIRDV
jgi:predicted nucleic acid-binding protein